MHPWSGTGEPLKFYSGVANELDYGDITIETGAGPRAWVVVNGPQVGSGSNAGRGSLTVGGGAAEGLAGLTSVGSGTHNADTEITATTTGSGDSEILLLSQNTSTGSAVITFTADDDIYHKIGSTTILAVDSGGIDLAGDLVFTETSGDYIRKQGDGDLLIENQNNTDDIRLRTSDSGGNVRDRIWIEGNSNMDFEDSTGTLRFRIDNNSALIADGDLTNPGLGFISDTNTGIYQPTDNQIAIATNGSQGLLIGTTGLQSTRQITFSDVYTSQAGASANVYVASGGRLTRITSARKYKEDIEWAPWLADIQLRPVRYKKKEEPRYYYGFIADELANEDSLLGVFDDGEIEDYDTRAVLAVLAAKIDRLESRLEACNCAV